MASRSRINNKGAKLTKMKMGGKGSGSPERFRYCREHDHLMQAVKTWGSGMHWECKEGCNLARDEAILK